MDLTFEKEREPGTSIKRSFHKPTALGDKSILNQPQFVKKLPQLLHLFDALD